MDVIWKADPGLRKNPNPNMKLGKQSLASHRFIEMGKGWEASRLLQGNDEVGVHKVIRSIRTLNLEDRFHSWAD